MGSKENGSPGKREDVLRRCQATTPAKGLYENPCLFPLLQVHFCVHISSLWQSVINSTPPLMSVFDSPPHLNSCCLSSQEGKVSAATVADGIVQVASHSTPLEMVVRRVIRLERNASRCRKTSVGQHNCLLSRFFFFKFSFKNPFKHFHSPLLYYALNSCGHKIWARLGIILRAQRD